MYFTNDEYVSRLLDLVAEKPQAVLISSFGIWASIRECGQDMTEWGEKYLSGSRKFLDALTDVPVVNIIIGVSEYVPCTKPEPCAGCEEKHIKQLMRVLAHAEKFKDFNWYVTSKHHLKCVLFIYGDKIKGLTGGRNLTDSQWDDMALDLTPSQTAETLKYFTKIQGLAQSTTRETILAMMNQMEPRCGTA